ncbi:MAG: hypothetical protein JO199_02765 [Candidatus Eremiobacteraeota bacterium]|nr:hypothetical protein [Candidatus Eremiobacteraeota bacterium]
MAPYAGDVVAIALDDDQGAYIDNDTWPAPHWHAYIGWLRLTVQSAAGSRVPLFINTFESRVTAAAPAWAWGDWYQSDAYSIGEHDLSEIDFSTGLLATQPHLPVMMAEFQAGWLQGADEGAPRPADPANTTLALHEFLRDGAGGIVNFPVQDTVYPGGWEAPWANWSYAWDAALTSQLQASGRYAPTAAFGDAIQRYGPLLAGTHPAADAAIVWPPSLFSSSILTGGDYAAFRDATIAAQRACVARGLTCALVDVAYDDQATLDRYATIVVPISVTQRLENAIERPVRDRLAKLRSQGRLASDVSGISPLLGGVQDATLLLADDGSGRNFIDAINPSDSTRSVGPLSIPREGVYVRRFDLPPRSARIFPVGSATSIPVVLPESPPAGTPPPFAAAAAESISSTFLHVAIDPNAGARVAELSAAGVDNAASSIGLLRDAVEPSPPSSARDYIAPYTHPLPAGTFNRPYFCTSAATADETRVECTYDAPDLPNGGATFSRTYDLASDGRTLVVKERFAPRDATSTASLASVSGFAFVQGDTVVAPSGAPYVGILHGHRLAAISWQPGDVAAVQLRSTRGAELVSLTFAKRSVRLALGIYAAGDPAEAERLLQANAASRLR